MTGPESQNAARDDEQAVPVCLECLTPYEPLQHYCTKCGSTVGQLSPYIPYVNIPFNYSIFRTMWRRIWSGTGTPVYLKVFCAVMIVLFAPVMLIGIPFLLIARLQQKRGSDRAAE